MATTGPRRVNASRNPQVAPTVAAILDHVARKHTDPTDLDELLMLAATDGLLPEEASGGYGVVPDDEAIGIEWILRAPNPTVTDDEGDKVLLLLPEYDGNVFSPKWRGKAIVILLGKASVEHAHLILVAMHYRTLFGR